MIEWIDQYEYRWQPTIDFSLIAGSRQIPEMSRWSDLISLWVRHPPVGAPVHSVRYEIFEDDTAALAWRQRDTQADGFQDETEGRPEVSRLLIGPVQLLTPGIAVALCRTGLPEALIGPRPGLVPPGIPLPQVDAAALGSLARSEAAALDKQASSERVGLHKVIATALTDVDTPLSVQLPARYILGPLQDGKQGSLMWGLVRTLLPLLGFDCGRRGWSFSTFEQPLGDTDTRGLPDIVFRTHGSSQRPANMRPENVVRPFDASDLSDKIQYQEFADLLVAAYRLLGGKLLGQCLASIHKLPSLEQRIEQAEGTLYEALPAEALSMARQRRASGTGSSVTEPPTTEPPARDVSLTGQPGWPQDASTFDGFPTDTPTASSRPVVSAPPLPADAPPPYKPSAAATPPQRPEPPYWQKEAEASQVASGRATQAAPPLSTGANRLPRIGTPPRSSLSSVLDQLNEGSADSGFESAWESLWTGNFADLPAERHTARRRLPERGWYIPALRQHDGAHFEETLVRIFEHAVVPDLGHPEVTEELARWASLPGTPPSVFRALNAAAQTWPGWPELLDQILVPTVGRRWLAEHEVYVGSEYAAAVQGQRPPSPGVRARSKTDGRRKKGGLLDRRLFGDPVTLLSLFCAVLFTLLVLELVH